MYSSPLICTGQYKFCGNPLRIDLYKGCDFGCTYCFANTRTEGRGDEVSLKYAGGWDSTSKKILRKIFFGAFDSVRPVLNNNKGIVREMVSKKVPMHCGGMSDPFQTREWDDGLTYYLIELSNEYQYPIMFSTKVAELPDKYWDILDPKLHALQVSIIGYSDNFIKRYETNTPTAQERINFLKKSKSKGFWTCLRMQPLVDINEGMILAEKAGDCIDYLIVEHLKIAKNNDDLAKRFLEDYKNTQYYQPPWGQYKLVLPKIKEDNFNKIAEIANKYGVKVGCGDNDLHHISQSRCCCGVDTIPSKAFDNWLKYNLTYFVTGSNEPSKEEIESLYIPDFNYYQPFSSKVGYARGKTTKFKDYIDEYLENNRYLLEVAGRENILNKIKNKKSPTKINLF